MKAYSGSSSDGFMPTLTSANSTTATAVAPEPQDPTATFTDVLDQQEGGSATSWTGLATAPLADPAAQPMLTPVALVTHSDPAPATTAALTARPALPGFFAQTATRNASAGTTTAPISAGTASDPTTSSTPVADDAQTELRRYVWFGLPKATTTSTTTTDLSSREKTASTPLPTFTIPGRAKSAGSTAPTSETPADTATAEPTRLTLSQYLLFGQQTKPATPSPLTTTTKMPADSDVDQGTAPGKFKLPGFLGTSRVKVPVTTSSVLPPTIKAMATSSVADSAPDFSSAAIVASVTSPASTAPIVSAQAANTKAAKTPVSPTQSGAQAPLVSTTARALFSTTPLVSSMAHVTLLAAARPASTETAVATSTDASTETLTFDSAIESAPTLAAPQLNWISKPAAPSAVEKKSASSASERSSIPAKTDASLRGDTTSSLLQAALAASTNITVNQSVATTSTAPVKSSLGFAAGPLASAGTTNDKNQSDMTSNLDMQNVVVSGGTHPLVTQTDADLHIQLGTNADFHHALDQVMHVADMSNLSRVTPPLRVAIEIQTPPGAIVNVYISRQPDSSYRAQLSTNDAQALGWVQQQIGSLKDTSDAGTAIRWSPAQLDLGTSATAGSSSSGSDRNLDWERGGQQGHPGHQDEERDARHRPAYAQADETETLGFFETVTAVGGIA